MKVEDRFTRGLLAGLIAGVPTFIFNHGLFYLKMTNLRWSDFMSLFIYGRKPVNLAEDVFAVFLVYMLLSFLGIVFAYLLLITNTIHILKGCVYGISIWFISYTITFLFKVPELEYIPLETAFFNFIGAGIWGVTLALTLKWLDSKLVS